MRLTKILFDEECEQFIESDVGHICYSKVYLTKPFEEWLSNINYRIWTEVEFNKSFKAWIMIALMIEIEESSFVEFQLRWL